MQENENNKAEIYLKLKKIKTNKERTIMIIFNNWSRKKISRNKKLKK